MSRYYFERRYGLGESGFKSVALNIKLREIMADETESKPEPSNEPATPPPTPSKVVIGSAPTKSTPPAKLDFAKAVDNVTNVENHVMTFKGKAGMNPYAWIKDNIEPLKSRYNKGERSLELFAAMSGLEKCEPTAKSNKQVGEEALRKQREARRNAPKPPVN
jgi:hypothetical protein